MAGYSCHFPRNGHSYLHPSPQKTKSKSKSQKQSQEQHRIAKYLIWFHSLVMSPKIVYYKFYINIFFFLCNKKWDEIWGLPKVNTVPKSQRQTESINLRIYKSPPNKVLTPTAGVELCTLVVYVSTLDQLNQLPLALLYLSYLY